MSEPGIIWFRLRGLLIVPFFLFSILWDGGEVNNLSLRYSLGAVLFAIGLYLRIWSQMHLHYRLKTHKVLTLTGPYVHVRNPIYIGNTFILTGITVLAGLLWFVPIMILACAFTYHQTVLYEESHLKEKYGQGYIEFMDRVPRWMPVFKGVEERPGKNMQEFFWPSIFAELHILLLLVPLILKEIFL